MNKIKKFIKTSPVLAIILGLVLAGGASAALLTVYVTLNGEAQVEQSVVFCQDDYMNHSYVVGGGINPIAGNTYTNEEDCIRNRSYTTAPVEFVTTSCIWGSGVCVNNPSHIEEGITTTYWNTVVLEDKDIDWNIKNSQNQWEKDIQGTLKYELAASEFNYEFGADVLAADTEYSLIYYADYDERFDQWGGDNPGVLIGTFTSDESGHITTDGVVSVDLGMDLPTAPDWNQTAEANYCDKNNKLDDFELCRGAKVWLVKSDNYNENTVVGWNPEDFLFETDMMVYNDTDVDGLGLYLSEGSMPGFFVKNAFDVKTAPNKYRIVTEIKPVQ